MFWIVGGGTFVLAFAEASGAELWKPIVEQLEHAGRNGFTSWDLIFPLFIHV